MEKTPEEQRLYQFCQNVAEVAQKNGFQGVFYFVNERNTRFASSGVIGLGHSETIAACAEIVTDITNARRKHIGQVSEAEYLDE